SGIRTLKRDERTGPIIGMRCIDPSDDILLITRNSIVLRTRLEQIRETGRSAIGVRVMDLAEGDEIVGIAIMNEPDATAVNANGHLDDDVAVGE
ncbi:MAG: DNA gyrase subunit A, partial [Anaerolineae bacterium]|nr:DNA gyrase subunit A [Anaerolineae bacterium]